MKHIPFPENDEFPEYVHQYYKYVIKDGSLLTQLGNNLKTILSLIRSVPEHLLEIKQGIDEWSIKEILVHIIDDERIYAYRALRYARNDKIILMGFDQDYFTKHSNANIRSIDSIMDEYQAVRMSTISMFNGFDNKIFSNVGQTNESKSSVRALGYHIAGHELHHFHKIKELILTLNH